VARNDFELDGGLDAFFGQIDRCILELRQVFDRIHNSTERYCELPNVVDRVELRFREFSYLLDVIRCFAAVFSQSQSRFQSLPQSQCVVESVCWACGL